MKRAQVILVMLVAWCHLQMAAAAEITSSAMGWSIREGIGGQPESVSALQLLVNPKQYDGKVVRVLGVLSVEFEDQRIYMNKEFYNEFQPAYAVALSLPPGGREVSTRFQGKYVIVEGKFVLKPTTFGVGTVDVRAVQFVERRRSKG